MGPVFKGCLSGRRQQSNDKPWQKMLPHGWSISIQMLHLESRLPISEMYQQKVNKITVVPIYINLPTSKNMDTTDDLEA